MTNQNIVDIYCVRITFMNEMTDLCKGLSLSVKFTANIKNIYEPSIRMCLEQTTLINNIKTN